MGLPLAVSALPAFRNSSFPALTDTVAPFRSASRVRNTASDSCDWSICGTGICFSESATLAVSLLRFAMVLTSSPRVVSCHDSSRRELSVPRKSALRARIVKVSGAPRCSISSTVKSPLFSNAEPCQPSHSVSTAPRRVTRLFRRNRRAQCRAGQPQNPGCRSW